MRRSLKLQQKILIFFFIIVILFLANFNALNIVLDNSKELNALKTLLSENSVRIYKMTNHCHQIASGREIEKNDLEAEIRKFNQNINLVQVGGLYDFGDEKMTLPPIEQINEKLSSKYLGVVTIWEELQKHLIEVAETPAFTDSIFNYYERMENYGITSFSEYVPAQKRFKVISPEFKNSLEYVVDASPKLYSANQAMLDIVILELASTQSQLTFVSFLFIIIILMSLGVGYFFIVTSTLKPLSQVTKVADLISSGELTSTLREGQKDEIGLLIRSINGLIASLQKISDFATAVGQGNFDVDFQIRSEKDQLGIALLNMRDNLKRNAEEDMKRNWANEGFAKFSEILRANTNDIEKLAYNIISNLTRYIEANQAGLFLISGEENRKRLELVASYAYGKQKYIQKTLPITQGLLGQAILEEKTIHLTEIPQGYTEITSGLGEATPKSLLITPLKINDEIHGVLEIASFKDFKDYQISFVEKLAENIASTIATVKSANRTRQLLKESQLYAEQLRSQEEEMRQNMEELSATQEEMKRIQMEIKAKESNLDAIINNTKEIIFYLSRNQRVILYNRASIEFFEKEGIGSIRQGIKFYDILPQHKQDFFRQYITRALKGEYITTIERETIGKDDVYWEIDFIPVRNNENDIDGVSIFMRDITYKHPIRWQTEVRL
ncbi:MAG: GAF domain-containing protein [Cytophagales bacterium]|nr:GAF domain-containing protein [Cytophagales bacterium]MDW8383830.1 GAF domain-containing protein [Flammeovirgaceae bacterium]